LLKTPLTTTRNRRTTTGIRGKPGKYKYELNIPKLWSDLDSKRRKDRLSWARLAARYNIGPTTFVGMKGNPRKPEKRTINANVLICVLHFLNKPLSDYVIENRVGYDE
jgi:hypothetical protein